MEVAVVSFVSFLVSLVWFVFAVAASLVRSRKELDEPFTP